MPRSSLPVARHGWAARSLVLILAWAGATAGMGQAISVVAADPRADIAADRAQDVVDAVRYAFGLESAYWENPAAFRTDDSVYTYFRRGFSPDLAAAMTAHVLAGDGDLATWVPQEVYVAELEPSHALVWFPTPAPFGQGGLWDLADYMHVRLRREDDGWVVDWAEDRPAPPAR